MKTKYLLTRLMTITILTTFVVTGCKKETAETLTPQEEQEAATTINESQTESELVFNDVFDNVMGVNTEVGLGGTGIFGRLTTIPENAAGREMDTDSIHCWTITKTHLNPPQAFPLQITLDFGAGCKGPDGRVRSGKIVIVYTGRLINPGTSATVEFVNFKINKIAVEGIMKISNTTGSTPQSNQKQFTVTVRNAKLTKHNGNSTEWKSDRVITQLEGNGTLLPFDDILRIEGSAEGKVKRGNRVFVWTAEITEPLIKKFTCRWISKGVIKTRRSHLSTSSQWVAVLDFGPGSCDSLATLTINGVSHQIQLPH